MKEITGEHKRIDKVLQMVDSMVVPIRELEFEPFDSKEKENWKEVVQDFESKVQVRL